jgi:hypothetical protein
MAGQIRPFFYCSVLVSVVMDNGFALTIDADVNLVETALTIRNGTD